jgi:hypothetical protein
MTQVEQMAEFVHGARFEALGSDTCQILKSRILDSLGCSLGALHAADKCGQPDRSNLYYRPLRRGVCRLPASEGQTMPSARDIVEWLSLTNSQCPECGLRSGRHNRTLNE